MSKMHNEDYNAEV